MDENDRSANITFSNLSYKVPAVKEKTKKEILRSISGTFKSGELNAIMGPSGAGKSSLMNILTGFIKKGVKGSIKFGNTIKSRKLCCYILQEDHFFPWFTVEELMLLAATLKISNQSMTFIEKKLLINNILEMLHLTNAKKTKCSNLSGGQKKRLSIAVELIDNPPIIFLDEPTTGLDSSTTLDLVKLLKNICSDGRTIVCTIHQPTASIYLMFDHIYVLDKGMCVYQGKPENTIPFIESIGLKCPEYHNPADYLLETITGAYGNYTNDMIKSASTKKWCQSLLLLNNSSCDNNDMIIISNEYNNSTLINDSNKKMLLSKSTNNGNHNNHNAIPIKSKTNHIYPPPEWFRLWLLIGRCHMQFYRDWTVTHLKLFLHVICSILIGLLYGDSGVNATKTFSNISLFLVGIIYLWYTTIMPGILKFPTEIAIIKRETFNNWYKIRTYYLATIITSTPVHILFATIFSTIIYLLTQQPPELERYVKFCLINIILTIAADGFGILIGTLVNPVNGTFIGAIITCLMLLFSGFLIIFEHMSSFMRAITYSSPQRYAFESIVLAMYSNDRSDMICPSDVIYCHLKSANHILKNMGMLNGDFNFNIIMLLIQTGLFKGLSYFTLKRALENQ